eukprot:Lithocolla_globosa_v1_NODE_5799_length_1172_cov_8.772848.p1 type:complete len:155 gc:universal NODE_5799_length_1172_cov_8.772848:146-610(+)
MGQYLALTSASEATNEQIGQEGLVIFRGRGVADDLEMLRSFCPVHLATTRTKSSRTLTSSLISGPSNLTRINQSSVVASRELCVLSLIRFWAENPRSHGTLLSGRVKKMHTSSLELGRFNNCRKSQRSNRGTGCWSPWFCEKQNGKRQKVTPPS